MLLVTFDERPHRTFGPYRTVSEARDAFQRQYGYWPTSDYTESAWEPNALVRSGEYERVYAGDIEPGAVLAAHDDATVVKVTSYGPSVSLYLTVGVGNYHRDTVLLVKTGTQM